MVDAFANPIGWPTVSDPPQENVALRYSHSGERYVLGYGSEFFGIWDRAAPADPVSRYPRSDAGWQQAWAEFTSREANFVPVESPPPSAVPAATIGSTVQPAPPAGAPGPTPI